jgi:hypothetical protein
MIRTSGVSNLPCGGGVWQLGVVGDSGRVGRSGIDLSTSKVSEMLLEAEEFVNVESRLGRPLVFLIAPTGEDAGEDERGLD